MSTKSNEQLTVLMDFCEKNAVALTAAYHEVVADKGEMRKYLSACLVLHADALAPVFYEAINNLPRESVTEGTRKFLLEANELVKPMLTVYTAAFDVVPEETAEDISAQEDYRRSLQGDEEFVTVDVKGSPPGEEDLRHRVDENYRGNLEGTFRLAARVVNRWCRDYQVREKRKKRLKREKANPFGFLTLVQKP